MNHVPLIALGEVTFGWPFASDHFTADADVGGRRVLRIRDLVSDEDAIYTEELPPIDVRVMAGDVLIGMDGDFNVVRWSGEPALLNQRMARLRGRADSDVRYLDYAIRRPLRVVNDLKHATTVKHLSAGDLRKLRIPGHSSEEQRAIADFLDHECARIAALEDRSALLQAQMTHVTDAVATEAYARYSSSTRPLWSCTDRGRPIMYGIVLPGEHVPGGVPIVKGGDVERGRLDPDLLNRTTPEIDAAYARSRLLGGDLLVTIRGSYGACAIVPESLTGANITQDAARVAPAGHIDPRWLRLMLRSEQVRDQLRLVAVGATIRGVNIRDLKRVHVAIPALSSQREGSEEAENRLAAFARSASVLDATQSAISEYRSSLIHEAVTGKLDVTRVSDRQMDERLHAVSEARLDEVTV